MPAARGEKPDNTVEQPLDPDLPICDAHHHLWYLTQPEYTVEDFLQDISGGHNVCRTVFVESGLMFKTSAPPPLQPVGETEAVKKLTENYTGRNRKPAVAAGIIGFADLTLGTAVAPVLEAHLEAGGNRFKGVRYITAWDASPELKSRRAVPPALLMDSRFREGFATLGRYGLSFDAWLYHPQLGELLDLARAFPNIRIIIDHAGGPLGIGHYAAKRDEVFKEWQKKMAELSRCPHVYVKLGGLGMRICGFGWDNAEKPPDSEKLARAFAPYYLWCIEHFGVDRSMFESNFPVDKASYSYLTLWNAFKRLTAGFSREERLALFHNTAVKAYRLDN